MGRIFHIRQPSAGILAFIAMLIFMVSVMLAQEEKEEEEVHRVREVEQKLVDNSYVFFCDRIIESDTSLAGATIIFEGKTTPVYSPVIYVADCAGDIDMVKNRIPDRDYIDRLQEHYDRLPPEYREVTDIDKRTKKFVLFPGKKTICYLNIYRPIDYKGKYYVLYYILFEKEQKLFYSISLDDDYQVIDFCAKLYKL
ncbi:MAG: hypothetical protein V2I47_12155 [Bacteroidales bacterium]|jgi:hypothetical protein|nr:hypothetical protein [Bacteroidales bacterium]